MQPASAPLPAPLLCSRAPPSCPVYLGAALTLSHPNQPSGRITAACPLTVGAFCRPLATASSCCSTAQKKTRRAKRWQRLRRPPAPLQTLSRILPLFQSSGPCVRGTTRCRRVRERMQLSDYEVDANRLCSGVRCLFVCFPVDPAPRFVRLFKFYHAPHADPRHRRAIQYRAGRSARAHLSIRWPSLLIRSWWRLPARTVG